MNTGLAAPACRSAWMMRPGIDADVGPAVAADLGLVADAAERDPHELAVHRARDRLAERRLADAGRADEAEDRPLHVALELAHGEVLDDPLLDLVEIVVVLVEHAARLDRIDAILGRDAPRELEQHVHVRAHHLVLGRRAVHAREPIEFPGGDRVDGLGQVRLFDPIPELLDLVGLPFAELLLDRLQLLAQEVLALRVRHLLLGLRLDAAFHLEQRNLPGERLRDDLELRQQIVGLEQPLLVGGGHVEQAAHEVCEPERILDA